MGCQELQDIDPGECASAENPSSCEAGFSPAALLRVPQLGVDVTERSIAGAD
jgi:hypothetical protein